MTAGTVSEGPSAVASQPADPAEMPSGHPVEPEAALLEIMRTTRAMRYLAPDPVPLGLIRLVIEAATWAPSGGNWQPARYLVVTDRARLQALAGLWGRVIDDFWLLAEASAPTMDADASRARTVAGIDYMRDHFAEIPALIVICENPDAPGLKRPGARAALTILRRGGVRRALRIARSGSPFIRSEGASFYPAAENLLLAARAHGLGACLTSWHLLAEAEFKRVLGIPPDVRTWAIIPIGYPLKPFGPVRRRPVEEAIRWDTWSVGED